MKNFSLKALGAFIVAAGLVVAGVAAPASAADMTSGATATATGAIANTGTNAYPITVTATTISPVGTGPSTILNYVIQLPTGWTFVTTFGGPNCNYSQISFSGLTASNGCSGYNTGTPKLTFFTLGIPASSTVQVTFAAGSLNVSASRTFTILTENSGTADSGTAVLSSSPSSSSVTFDANGGTGTTATQTASAATALTSNGFTRSGYNFTGWNTAANGTGTAYGDGASYAFTSSTTLYAQWSATLANTGIKSATGISLLAGGLSLALVGAEMFIIARRKTVKAQK